MISMNERVIKLENALRELHEMVWAECHSLLNEDSGGDVNLDMRIRELLGEFE